MTSGMWYRAPLTNEQIEAGHVEIARRLFADAVREAPNSAGACLFVLHRDIPDALPTAGAGAGEPEALFFSPLSISVVPHLIAKYGAQPSEPPQRRGAVLLVGCERDWDLLPRSSH